MSARRKIIDEFIDTTSLNGLQRICLKNPLRRHCWTIMIVLIFICFGVHFHFLLSNYLSYRTNSGTSLSEYHFEFPDVTICAIKPFDVHKGNKSNLGIDGAAKFWNYALKYKTHTQAIQHEIAFHLGKLSFVANSSKHRDFYVDILEHIHYCIYNYEFCKVSDFSVIHIPERINNCITFHPKQRYLTSAGQEYGLNIFINTAQSYSILSDLGKIVVYDGFQLIIHDNGSYPDMSQLSFTLQKGKANVIGLTLGVYEKLSTPLNPCNAENVWENFSLNIDSSTPSHTKFHKNIATCKILRDQYEAIRKCGCWREDEIIPGNKNETFNPADFPMCHSLPEYFYYNENVFSNGSLFYKGELHQLDENNTEFMNVKNRALCIEKVKNQMKYSNSGHIINCIHSCKKKSYMAEVFNIDYNLNFSQFVELYDDFFFRSSLNTSDFREMSNELDNGRNLMMMSIYAADLDVMNTKESLAYPLSTLFSDIGGNIGLWIGCTVITIVEVIELILRLIIERVNKKKMNSKLKDTGEHL